MRVRTTLPLEIDRAPRPAGFEMDIPLPDARAMRDAGRAVFLEPEPEPEPEQPSVAPLDPQEA